LTFFFKNELFSKDFFKLGLVPQTFRKELSDTRSFAMLQLIFSEGARNPIILEFSGKLILLQSSREWNFDELFFCTI
jgi:hypothetical protein